MDRSRFQRSDNTTVSQGVLKRHNKQYTKIILPVNICQLCQQLFGMSLELRRIGTRRLPASQLMWLASYR